jgi:PAS domain S-box-containing protein
MDMSSMHSPLTNTPFDFFTNWGQYVPRTHCMQGTNGGPDWPWIIGLTLLNGGVIAGYLKIFAFWRKSYLEEEERDRNIKLMQLAYIFLWCAVCGYAFSLVSFIWPGYRLLAIFLAILNFFTWKFATSLGGFKPSFSVIRLQRQLEESLRDRAQKLEAEVAARTAELTAKNAETRKLALVAARTGNAVIITDAHGRIEWVNDSFTKITGYSPDEVIGRKPGSFLQGPDTDPAQVARIRAAVHAGQSAEAELVNYSKDGVPYWIKIEVQPIRDEQGNVERFIAIESDITTAKRQEAELAKARDAADAANHAKSEFLANMSHEIRTPLGAVIGFSDLLVNDPAASEHDRRQWAQTIGTSARHLLTLINDVLDISKIEAGRLELEKLPVSPHAMVSEVASIMRVPASEKGLQLDLRFTGPLPEQIRTDPTRVRQVLLNLLNNAVKFTQRGGIRLIVGSDTSASSPRLLVHVQDTGIGMSPDQLSRLFKPFSQADSSVTRRFGGTGLGLTISKRICEALGGDLTVQTTPGVGSTFTASIAMGEIQGAKLVDSHVSEPVRQCVATAKTLQLTGLRVLVADDGQTNRRLLSILLTRAGAEVDTATNGLEALNKLLALHSSSPQDLPDVVLMDMQMPEMDGYTATRKLRDANLRIPIIALTAHAMVEDRQRCIDAGCDDYLTKPVDTQALMKTVHQWSRLSRQSPTDPADSLPTSPAHSSLPSTPPTPDDLPSNPIPLGEPILSDLWSEDAELRDIVREFVLSLDARLPEFDAAIANANWRELSHLGHWLRGGGGSAGYRQLTELGTLLELAGKASDPAAASRALEKLKATMPSIKHGITRKAA